MTQLPYRRRWYERRLAEAEANLADRRQEAAVVAENLELVRELPFRGQAQQQQRDLIRELQQEIDRLKVLVFLATTEPGCEGTRDE